LYIEVNVGFNIPPSVLAEVIASNSKIVSAGSDGLLILKSTLTKDEIKALEAIALGFDGYTSYDPNNFWKLTPAQLDAWFDSNVRDLASTKEGLKALARSVLFLLQRGLI